MSEFWVPPDAHCGDCKRELTTQNVMPRLVAEAAVNVPGQKPEWVLQELICMDCYLTNPHPLVEREE
jgi:hypothetical protein